MVAEGRRFDIVLAMEVIEHVVIRRPLSRPVRRREARRAPGDGDAQPHAEILRARHCGAEYVLRWLPRGTHDWEKFITPDELSG